MPGYMERITRRDIKQNNKEMLNTFHWELVITKLPSAIYYPGDGIIQVRLKEVTNLPESRATAPLATKIRGQTVQNPGIAENDAKGVTFTFQDFEDNSIEAMLIDYSYKSDNPSDHRALHKSALLMDCELYRLNSALLPVQKWVLQSGLPSSIAMPGGFTGEKTIIEGHNLQMDFEYAEKVLLNTGSALNLNI